MMAPPRKNKSWTRTARRTRIKIKATTIITIATTTKKQMMLTMFQIPKRKPKQSNKSKKLKGNKNNKNNNKLKNPPEHHTKDYQSIWLLYK